MSTPTIIWLVKGHVPYETEYTIAAYDNEHAALQHKQHLADTNEAYEEAIKQWLSSGGEQPEAPKDSDAASFSVTPRVLSSTFTKP